MILKNQSMHVIRTHAHPHTHTQTDYINNDIAFGVAC